MHSDLISINFSLEADILLACFVSKEATDFGQIPMFFFSFSFPVFSFFQPHHRKQYKGEKSYNYFLKKMSEFVCLN